MTSEARNGGSLGRFVRRYRRRKTSRVWRYHPLNTDAEPGDLMVAYDGRLFRLEESSGWGKRMAGELTLRTIKPPRLGLRAELREGEIWWVQPNSVMSVNDANRNSIKP